MGANASTAVPLYASGQVLDAARLNLTNAGIPVFSGTATRDAAFGGSGEKVLAEGQFAYLEDTNSVQFYDSAAWQLVGGKVLQVVQATYNTEMTTTSTSYVTGNFTATITPSFATSKVLIFCAVSGRGPANEQQRLTIFRGTVAGTNLATDGLASQGAINSQATITFLDSPNTTSAQVYTLATKSAASGTSVLHIANTTSVFVLIEIGA